MRVQRGAEAAGSTQAVALYGAHIALQLRGLGPLGEVQIGSTECDEPSAKRANIQWQGWVQPPTVRLCGAATEDVLQYTSDTEDPATAQFAAARDWILRCNTAQDVWVSLMPELFTLTAQAGVWPLAAGCSGLCVRQMRSARKVNAMTGRHTSLQVTLTRRRRWQLRAASRAATAAPRRHCCAAWLHCCATGAGRRGRSCDAAGHGSSGWAGIHAAGRARHRQRSFGGSASAVRDGAWRRSCTWRRRALRCGGKLGVAWFR